MASKEKDSTNQPMTMMSPRAKHAFFEECHAKHKELSKNQREYKKALSRRLKERSERIKEMSYAKAIDRLQAERNDLRAQIWVANAHCHGSADERYLEEIQCHIQCQDRLSVNINNLKKLISNLQREKSRAEKQIYELNRKTVADSRHQAFVAQVRKQFSILENRVEVGVRHECAVTAANAALKEQIKTLVANCELFNNSFIKKLQKLYDDKKYLMDLFEDASRAYEGAIETNEKILNSRQKGGKESEQAKLKVQSIMRDAAAAELASGFMSCKNQHRPLANLPPSELNRRKNFKADKVRKINLYNTVLSKIYDYTQSLNIYTSIDKFQQQESLYHSFFNCANRTSFHLTSLENAVNQLCVDIANTKKLNRLSFSNQHEVVNDLMLKLDEQKKRNRKLDIEVLSNRKSYDRFCGEIATIFNLCRADATPLISLLGTQNYINKYNLSGFMKVLEKQISHIVRAVCIHERENMRIMPDKYTVTEVGPHSEAPTNLDDIVLTQQCPECAEGEIFNTADADQDGGGVELKCLDDVKQKIYEEVSQPEMQYRLHSISQCRLPKSRLLAAKRYD